MPIPLFQFTPLREGRRGGSAKGNRLSISIHAPPRGATSAHTRSGDSEPISIHAPPRGATIVIILSQTCCLFQFTPLREGRLKPQYLAADGTFQFTPLREGRRGITAICPATLYISIHAPPRGATKRSLRVCVLMIFQFTPLREGRRLPQEWYYSIYDISIHAPPRGATGCRRSGIIVYTIFQFTPLREGRRGRLRRFYFHDFISIHAPPRGATHTVRLIASCPFISIHAPPRGATLPKMNRGSYLFYFNSRPSARGDLEVRPCGKF